MLRDFNGTLYLTFFVSTIQKLNFCANDVYLLYDPQNPHESKGILFIEKQFLLKTKIEDCVRSIVLRIFRSNSRVQSKYFSLAILVSQSDKYLQNVIGVQKLNKFCNFLPCGISRKRLRALVKVKHFRSNKTHKVQF